MNGPIPGGWPVDRRRIGDFTAIDNGTRPPESWWNNGFPAPNGNTGHTDAPHGPHAAPNGHATGARLNGARFNGTGSNGASSNGAGSNGVGSNGAGANGAAPNGAGANGAGAEWRSNGAGPDHSTNGAGPNRDTDQRSDPASAAGPPALPEPSTGDGRPDGIDRESFG
jgi:hypothetical protein